MEGGSSTGDGEAVISVIVKFAGAPIAISISPNSTIRDLKSLLQPLTNVLPRGQRLISKGKLLVDEMTIRDSEVANGSKIMLVASQGLHQGDGPLLKQAQTRPISRAGNTNETVKGNLKESLGISFKNRVERWQVTGVIALSECNLKAIPDEIWGVKAPARVLDLSKNAIREIPLKIGSLKISKLFLSANELVDGSISWEGLASLTCLEVLTLNQNHLTILPSAVGRLTSLKELNIANNKLTSLPNEIGLLTQLEILKANSNRIRTLPSSFGNCTALIEVELSSNYLSELPDTLGNFRNLKSLHLGNNGLKSLPSIIFKACLQLTTLDLHNTEITMDTLRQCEGWESFDDRRRSKHQKQLDFRIGSAAFDEGADKN